MFTRQLIEEIKNKLYLLGKKDSLFDLVEDVGNDAYFSIVVDGENKRVSVQKFIDIVAEAISESKVGISLEFGDSILEGISLKTLTEALNAIYVVDEDSIIARSIYRTVILPPNMDEHNSCKLTQDMLLTPNTKYVIKYNYDVLENITVPANCILSVDGGKLFSSSGMKTITGVRNTFPDNADYTLFETILPDEVCVDLDSITLTNFSYASEGGDIDPERIPAQSIDNTKLEDGAVTEPILANSAVTENKIANSAVTSNKIAANAVGENNIADNAVTEVKLKDGSVTPAKLAQSIVTDVIAPAIESGIATKQDVLIDSGQNQNIKTINGSSILGEGDLEVLTEVEDGSITTEKIAQEAVTSNILANNAVYRAKILDGAVGSDKLGGLSVTTSKIVSNAVTEDKIANSSISNNKIVDGAVSADKLSNNAVTSSKLAGKSITEDKLSDDLKNKIDDTYSKSEVYTKTQVDGYVGERTYTKTLIDDMLVTAPDTPVVVLSALDGDDPLDVLAEVPAVDRPNKLFRVRNADNTSFGEYAYLGDDQWELLADRLYGIDEEVEQYSSNLVTSDAVSKVAGTLVPKETNAIYAITDSEGKVLLALNDDGSADIPGLPDTRDESYMEMIQITLDANNKIVSYRRQDGTLVEPKIETDDLKVSGVNVIPNSTIVDSDNWEVPLTKGEKQVIPKSDSMVKLRWTPKSPIATKRIFDNDFSTDTWWYQKDVEVEGIPYSASYNINKIVGYDVSIETFMTAINNPYSLIYTEFLPLRYPIDADPPQSAYGLYYCGLNAYAGSYYGSICSAFTSYCNGFIDDFRSEDYPNLLSLRGEVGRILPQNGVCVKTGDVWYVPGHCVLIKNVKRDSDGKVDKILTSEQNRLHCYETEYTLEEFNSKFKSNIDAVLFRSTISYENKETFTFDLLNYVYNNDICTFAGNKACFRSSSVITEGTVLDDLKAQNHQIWYPDENGDIRLVTSGRLINKNKIIKYVFNEDEQTHVINNQRIECQGDQIYIDCFNCFGSGGYTHMELYKDDGVTPIRTIELTTGDNRVCRADLADNSARIPYYRAILKDNNNPVAAYAVNLSNEGLEYGSYKARLKAGNVYSDFTYFEIVDANVTYTKPADDYALVKFSSRNAIPMMLKIVNGRTDDRGSEDFVENDERIGTVLDPRAYWPDGLCQGYYLITEDNYVVDENGAHGEVLISPYDFMDQGRSPQITSNSTCYLRVYFKTDNGRVTNVELPIKFIFTTN